ncbi:hypothetical protein Pelo_10005 [Pelomyxa schiedti]|nr:hypothetical protein Pelo_10005 [Pelomyxa schiedti]
MSGATGAATDTKADIQVLDLQHGTTDTYNAEKEAAEKAKEANRKSGVPDAPLPARGRSLLKRKWLRALALVLVFGAFACGFAALGAWGFTKHVRNKNAIVLGSCFIMDSDVLEDTYFGDGLGNFRAQWSVNITIDGETYENRTALATTHHAVWTDEDTANEDIEQFEVGQTYDCHCDPAEVLSYPGEFDNTMRLYAFFIYDSKELWTLALAGGIVGAVMVFNFVAFGISVLIIILKKQGHKSKKQIEAKKKN